MSSREAICPPDSVERDSIVIQNSPFHKKKPNQKQKLFRSKGIHRSSLVRVDIARHGAVPCGGVRLAVASTWTRLVCSMTRAARFPASWVEAGSRAIPPSSVAFPRICNDGMKGERAYDNGADRFVWRKMNFRKFR